VAAEGKPPPDPLCALWLGYLVQLLR